MRLPKTNPNSTTGATLNPSTSLFSQNLDEVIAKLNKIAALIQQINATGVNGGSNPFAGTSTGTALAPATSGTTASLGGGGGASSSISGTATSAAPSIASPNQQVSFTPGGGLGASGFAALGFRGVVDSFGAGGMGYQIASNIGAAFSYQADRAIYGGNSPMGEGRLVGGWISAGLGVAAGVATGNPAIGAGVAAISGAIIDPITKALTAPGEALNQGLSGLAPFYNSFYGNAAYAPGYFADQSQVPSYLKVWPFNGNSAGAVGYTRLGQLASAINSTVAARMQTTAGIVGASIGGYAGGLYAGGIDPTAPGPGYNYSIPNIGAVSASGRAVMGYGADTAMGPYPKGHFSMLDRFVGVGIASIGANMRDPLVGHNPETLAETYARRTGFLYGKEAGEMTKVIAPIFGSLPETGGNTADILARYGPQNTLAFLRIQNEDLSSAVDPMLLSRTSAGMRGAERAARLGSLSARGSGAAIASAYGAEMDAIAGLPGGSSSVAYAEANSRRRDATAVAFQQAQDTRYGIPAAQLEGDYQRQALLPFSGTNQLTLGIRNITLNRQRIADLTTYEGQRRAKGDLSEEEELSLTRQIEGAKTAVAAGVATLSEGMENRLPALAAGKGTTFGRYSSLQLGSYYNKLIGSPVRSFGAVDSDQLRSQDQVFGNSGVSAQPYSQTQALNNGGGNGSVDRMVEILAQILGEMRRGGNVSGRSGAGQAYGEIGQKDLGADRLWDQRN